VAQGDIVSLGVAINGLELSATKINKINPLALTVIENPIPISVDPILSFVGDQNITFKIEAINLLNSESIACSFEGVFI